MLLTSCLYTSNINAKKFKSNHNFFKEKNMNNSVNWKLCGQFVTTQQSDTWINDCCDKWAIVDCPFTNTVQIHAQIWKGRQVRTKLFDINFWIVNETFPHTQPLKFLCLLGKLLDPKLLAM